MKTNIRHTKAPLPLGCRWCGVDFRDHCQMWVASVGWHVYAYPTAAQLQARLRVKLKGRS